MTENAPTSLLSEATTTPTTTPETEAPPANPEAAPDPNPAPAPSAVETEGAEGGSEGQPPSEPQPLALEDLTLPEGFEMPEGVGDEFLNLLNTPPESRAEFANALLGIHTSLIDNLAGEYARQWEQTQDDWRQQVQNLPEIGGKNLDKTMSQIAQVMDRYGDTEARVALAVTGAGNHPALVRLFHKIAKDLNEAPPVGGTPPSDAPRDRASRMFGNSEG